MPRIVPIQLLKCLKVLLDDNGGILSAGEVKRLASLMTKYSKKLVSKCIYVQILKCTKTELLGEFMGAGGWSLVYTWLNDAIRAMNWPLVQEILELLLLCPVDVHRLKINSAPKLVKGLCKDGGNEGVRILAKRLVEQWLKVVTENPEATLPTSNMTAQTSVVKTPTVAVVAPEAISVNVQQQTSMVNTTSQNSEQMQKEEQKHTTKQQQQKIKSNKNTNKVQDFEEEEEEVEDEEDEEEEEENSREIEQADKDPLGGVDSEPAATNYTLTPAQKKASESGLVYKFIIKDGQSILAKVPPKSAQLAADTQEEEEEVETESNELAEEDADETEAVEDTAEKTATITKADDNSSSLDKTEKDNDSNSGSEDKTKLEDAKKSEDKKTSEDKDKSVNQKDRRSSKDKERRGSSSSIDKEKEKDKDREGKSSKSSSSSSSHRSSSHKSSSSSSKNSSSKSSSSSSSSHRSSSDKHRSDKERSSSSKDKDRSGSSSSSSKHRSSSSKSSSSSSKDKYRDKDKSSSSSSSSSKSKDKQEQSDKDKATLEKVTSSSSSLDKLGKIPKKSKDESGTVDSESSAKTTSITIPSKKASMSIEIRKDTEKAKTVKTYKSQFRSHGLTEEAPPPPSRKGLKKPSSTTPPGTVLPSSLPSSLKRTSPPPRDSPSEKKAKIDINNVTVANEKPGAIKLIPPKKIQTLIETNLFSDALSASRGPKKVNKRKRPNTPLINGKESPASPTSPDSPKVMPLKFYQDTLDESKTEDSKSDKENDEAAATKSSDENALADDKDMEDDDDIPLKKVKEDIEQKVAQEKKLESGDAAASTIDITKDDDEENQGTESCSSPSQQQQGSPREENDDEMAEEKKPGPGCGPNGPPGVLMLHRRKGPKKKLSWRPQETLEQVRYFELDENERCNVTKTSFMDMKNLEHFNERDAIVLARRGFNQEDNMEAQTHWRPLMEVDEVPPHPEGNQSKQRKIQAERELTTLRALYFTHALIPDSPAEAEFEPAFNHDVPLIPLDDLTGNPDAVNDFTSMPWPEPRGSPKQGDNTMSGTGGLGSPVDIFGGNSAPMPNIVPNNNKQAGGNQFNPFVNPFGGNQGPNGPNGPPMQNSPQNQWDGPRNNMVGPMGGNGPMMGNPFNGGHGSPIMDMGGPGPMGPGPMMNNGPPQNFMNQFSPNFVGPPNNPFMGGPSGFNNGPNNFGPMGPNGPMMNGMGPGPMGNNCLPQMMNGGHNNRNNNNRGNNGGNWRSGVSNFQDNNGGGGNWRPAGPGPNNRNGGGNNNNGICKAFMRGHCRLGNSCKYIHPNKNKRI